MCTVSWDEHVGHREQPTPLDSTLLLYTLTHPPLEPKRQESTHRIIHVHFTWHPPSPGPRRGHWTLVKCMKLISQQFCCYHDYSVGLFKPQALPLLYTNTKLNNKRITKTQLRGIAHNAESSSAVYSSNSGAKLGFFIDATNQALVIFKGKIKQ